METIQEDISQERQVGISTYTQSTYPNRHRRKSECLRLEREAQRACR
jgi:hypothetical protein